MGEIISGKELSKEVREEVRLEVEGLKATYGAVPHLVVILVGNDPASESYVKAKKRACIKAGMESTIIRKETDISEEELLKIITDLNFVTLFVTIIVIPYLLLKLIFYIKSLIVLPFEFTPI